MKQVLNIDWNMIRGNDYLLTMKSNPAEGLEIKVLCNQVLTDKEGDQKSYIKDIETVTVIENIRSIKIAGIVHRLERID
ncbi:MAG: hypothetical protein ACOYCB_01210 [Fastidiosipilaceae bacterium]